MIDKILSWNVRGLNDHKKRTIIKGCINRWKPSVICIQETKMESINEKIIGSIWKADNIDWKYLPAKGSAGGILIMWRNDRVNCHGIIPGEITLSCLFSNLSNEDFWFFSGVYCRGNCEERIKLGNELKHIKDS